MLRTRHRSRGGGAVDAPLRTVATQNRLYNQRANSSGKNSFVLRYPYVVAMETKNLEIVHLNWWSDYTASGNAGLETNTGNNFTVTDASLTAPNGTVVPVYYGGARDKLLTNGDNNIHSDKLLPASFGYTTFPKGTYWVKARITLPAAGNYLPSNSQHNTGDLTGMQCAWYDSAVTTPSSTDIDGVYTATGTAFTTTSAGPIPVLLGTPVVEQDSYLILGDSIAHGANDGSGNGIGGRGMFQRAMYNYGTDPIASFNIAVTGARISLFTGGTKWKSYIQYARDSIECLGTNAINDAVALATIQTELQTVWTALKAGGSRYIYRMDMMTHTTSTDSWATEANQTAYNAGWAAGGTRDLLNAWSATKVTDGTLYKIIPMTYLLGTVSQNKFRCDDLSTAQYSTTDGLHPNSSGSANGAWQIRQKLIEGWTQSVSRVGNMSGWWDASDQTTVLDANGVAANAGGFLGKVATWTNKANGSYNATQTTDSNRPAFASKTINGITVPDFDGSDDFMSLNSAVFNYGGSTRVTVTLPDSTGTAIYILANNGSGGSQTRNYMVNQACDFGNTQLTRVTPVSGSAIAQIATVDKTGAGARQRLNINADAQLTGTLNRATPASTWAMGAYGTGATERFDGGIGEVVEFQRRLSPAEINYIAARINEKWGITVATVNY